MVEISPYSALSNLGRSSTDRESIAENFDTFLTLLTTQDWHGDEWAWNQQHIREGRICNGFWAIDVVADGRYCFELRRWPEEAHLEMTEGIGGEIKDWYTGGVALAIRTARMRVAEQQQTKEVAPDVKSVTFTFDLKAGETRMQTWLTGDDRLELGAYYVYAKRIG